VRRPDLFIIGAPKSGTTSLYSYLAGHPQVYMAPVKEPMFFCPDVRSGLGQDRRAHRHDDAAYLRLFVEARDQLRLGEATTRYLVSHDAPRLIRAFQAEPFVVAMLRNPVEMLHALHNERVSQGQEMLLDFAAALAADEARGRGELLPAGSNRLGIHYRDSARYGEQLARWYDALPRERIHVIVFDDFAADTADAFRRVLEFLRVDPDYQPESFAARNASHRQRPAVRRVMDSAPVRALTDSLLPRVIGGNARARLALRFRQSRLNRRAAPRAPIPPDLRRRLEDELRPDIERLSELLGRDLASLWLEPR
jgi:hypothetical protein